jgi:pyridoxal/pyridoxine/pyridoxamine kinase
LSGHLDRTLERAVAAMYALVETTHERRSRELALVAAQDQLASPRRQFAAERVR